MESQQPEPIPGLLQAVQGLKTVTTGGMSSEVVSALARMVKPGKKIREVVEPLSTTGSPMYDHVMQIFLSSMPKPLVEAFMVVNDHYKCPEMVCVGEIILPVIKVMMINQDLPQDDDHLQPMKVTSYGTYAEKVSLPPSKPMEGRQMMNSNPKDDSWPKQHYVGKVKPPQQTTNTLYMSKLPAEAKDQPIELLKIIGFPEAMFESPLIQVASGRNGNYFINGPTDDKKWASRILAYKSQTEIKHTEVHLAMGHPRSRRPPSEEQVKKREMVEEKVRNHFKKKEQKVNSNSNITRKRSSVMTTPAPSANKRVSDRPTPNDFLKHVDVDLDNIDEAVLPSPAGHIQWDTPGNIQRMEEDEEEKQGMGNKEKVI